MISFIAILVVVVIAAMILVSQRQSVASMKNQLKQAQERTIDLEHKIESSRVELRKSKEELEREKNSLRDARELAKKKLRTKANGENMEQRGQTIMNSVVDDSHKAISALEAQIEQLKKEQGQNEQALRARFLEEQSKDESEKSSQIEGFKKRIAELEADLKKQRRLMRPEGNKIDLKTLPDEAAGEFARVYRKAEQHERLHGIARAKLHLAQEKFTELQKRYFSVCRELAVLAGHKGDEMAARDTAESIVNKTMPETDAEKVEQ